MNIREKQFERGGAEARRIFARVGIALFLGCLMLGARDGKQTADEKPNAKTVPQSHMIPDETKIEVVPITEEHHHHLVLDNEYVRVFHVEVAPHAETLYHQHDMDYVFVTLGDSVVESVRVGETPVKLELKDGDTRFTKGGFAHKAVNLSDKPFVNVTVELKKAGLGGTTDGKPPCSLGGDCFLKVTDGRGFATFLTPAGKMTFVRYEIYPGDARSGGIKVGLGSRVSVKEHPALLVALTNVTVSSAAKPNTNLQQGDAMWIDSGHDYSAINKNKSFAKLVLIEFPTE